MSHQYPFNFAELSEVIINNAFDAIIYYLPVKDKKEKIIDFTFTYINDAALNVIAGTKKDYLGKNFLEIFPFAAENNLFRDFKETAETGKRIEEIYCYEEGDSKQWFRNSIVKYGEGIVVYFRNVTSRIQLETELKDKNNQLEKLLKEKELFLKETHHRVKNNLQIISSLLNLQKETINKKYYRDIIDITAQRINTMAIIHRQLYEEEASGSVSLKSFIGTIVSSLVGLYRNDRKRIRVSTDLDDISAGIDFSVKVGLILNELVTNSIKYAFNGLMEGEVKVSVKGVKSKIIIQVSDNGIGIPEKFISAESRTLGLTLVRSLVDELAGKLVMDGPPGTSIIISCPRRKI